jgi:hypothetical protein
MSARVLVLLLPAALVRREQKRSIARSSSGPTRRSHQLRVLEHVTKADRASLAPPQHERAHESYARAATFRVELESFTAPAGRLPFREAFEPAAPHTVSMMRRDVT